MKIFNKIKSLFFKNIVFIIGFILGLFVVLYEFPYYISAPGGVLDVKNKISIENSYDVSGSFNLAYVKEYKATIPTLIIANLNKNWDIVKKSDVLAANETDSDSLYRDKIMLEEANQNAVLYAYKKALKQVDIKSTRIIVTYVYEEAITDLKIGDEIISIDGEKINSKSELYSKIRSYNIGTEMSILVKHNDKEETRKAVIQGNDDVKVIGILISCLYDYDVSPEIKINFSSSESGPSGGLIMSLAIYNYLTDYDITSGLKIAGTGTIDENGNVGSIGGVKYKILGAVKDKIKYFIIPAGDNYEEAKKMVEENNYELKLIPVSTFDEALEELLKLKK